MPVTVCMSIDSEFFRRSKPACASPIAGVWSMTSVVANIM